MLVLTVMIVMLMTLLVLVPVLMLMLMLMLMLSKRQGIVAILGRRQLLSGPVGEKRRPVDDVLVGRRRRR